jgi:Ca-activated chloride channel family protein
MQDGIAAYRQKDYPRAIERFSTVGGAEGQYNLGNALAKAGRYDDAIAAYDRALALQPGMKDAAFNRNLVRVAKQLPKRPQDKGEDKDGKGGKDGQPPQASKPGQQGQAGKPQAPPAQGKGGQAGKPPQAPPQKDPQSQAQADAAQRERMQQALQKQQAKQPGQQPKPDQRGKPQETAEQRERRLANEAWLQRVPDDPGALLRARFQLEQQRRRGATP